MTEAELDERASKLQKTFWGSIFPILREEIPRLSVICAGFFLVAFVYTFLRLYKDCVIHTVLEASAQNWLKLFTFGCSLFVVGIIQTLLAKYGDDMDKVFEVSTLGFGVLLFALAFLIKYRDYVQLENGWTQKFFVGGTASTRGISILYVLFLIMNHWVLSLFYILAEVIGSIMVAYLFVTYIGGHCTVNQNKRFVRVMYLASNISGFLASQLYDTWNQATKTYSLEDRNSYYVYFTFGAVGIFGLIFALKRVLDRMFQNPIVIESGKVKKVKSKKKSVSIIDGIYYAFVSKLLLAMCAMTLFYNVSANLLTSLFTNSLGAAAVLENERKEVFQAVYKSIEFRGSALLVVIIMLSPCYKLFEMFGLGIFSAVPLIVSLFGTLISAWLAGMNYPALGGDNMMIASFLDTGVRRPILEVRANTMISMLSKASKYAFFDMVREALSMKINPEIRPLFRGVCDGACGRGGKFFGAIYGIVMEWITGVRDARYYAPVTFLLTAGFCVLWAMAIYYLHNSYKKVSGIKAYLSPDYIAGADLKDEE